MYGMVVYVHEHLVARKISLEFPDHSYMCLCLYLTRSYISCLFIVPSSSQDCCVLDIWYNTDKALSLYPFAKIFVFGEFNGHHTRWCQHTLTDLTGVQTLNFSITQSLTQALPFLMGFPRNPDVNASLLDHFVISIRVLRFYAFLENLIMWYWL